MRFIYTAFLLIFSSPLVFSQNIEFGPIEGNPVLRSHASQEENKRNAYLKRHFGITPGEGTDRNGLNMCPPILPPNTIIVDSGDSILVEVDTFGLAIDSTPAVLTLITDPPLLHGIATYVDSIITVVYDANPGIAGVSTDTVLVRYQQGGEVDTILKIAIDVRRKGKTIIADEMTIDGGDIVQYCLDDELGFPTPRKCFQFEDCISNYDGEGNQFKYFYNDSCFVYLSSRFPGTDTVCIQMCDEIGICDIFKVPFIIRSDTLSLVNEGPFFEDFSTADGPYPPKNLWLDDDVFINNTFSKNPPSVGMATFDGLSKGGKPYDLPAGGIGDRLTSKPIDLSGLSAGSNVYLRFFLSPKGYGQEPEEDDFFVEFRNQQGNWVEMLTVDGTGDLPFDSIPPFRFHAIKVEDAAFFHDAFQIRFSAESSPGGYGDWWHLDYIELKINTLDVNTFDDFAFSTVPQTFLKNYTAIPLAHLKADLEGEIRKVENENDSLKITVSNRSRLNVFNFSSSNITFEESLSGMQIGGTGFTIADENQSKTDTLSFREVNVDFPTNDRNKLIEDLSMLSGIGPFNIETEYWFVSNGNDSDPFLDNDSVTLNTPISDYFAHDDGSAEIQFFWNLPNGGEQTAVQYKTNVDDSLRGVRIMFPHFSFYDVESQFFNLKIWFGDENGIDSLAEPEFEMQLMKPYFPDNILDTLQGFTTYQLSDVFGDPDPLFIPANTYFYVGFEQVTSASRGIPIGYDLNNPCNCNFNRKTAESLWKPFSQFDPPGALMIRPVFAPVTDTTNPAEDVITTRNFIKVFPNPASDILNVEIEGERRREFEYLIYNQLGQLVQRGQVQSSINVGHLNDANYFLQILDKATGEVWVEKIVISR